MVLDQKPGCLDRAVERGFQEAKEHLKDWVALLV